MSLDKLFVPLLDYLNFFVDFARFDNMQQYISQGNISPVHLTNFLLGGLLSGFISANWGKFTSKEKIEFLDWKLLIIVPLVIINAVLWHLGMYLASLFLHFQIGSIKDSINVNFAAASVTLPFLALSKKALAATASVFPIKFLDRFSLAVVSIIFLLGLLVSSLNYFRFAALYCRLGLIHLLCSSAIYVMLAILFSIVAKRIFRLTRH